MARADAAQPVDRTVLERMTATLRHRGPDGAGFHLGPGVGLGVQRLRIMDLTTGDQPLYSEDGAVAVVCNGEIYNSPELRAELEAAGHRFRTASDVEVIPHLYEEHEVACLGRLRGMFAFALWDARRRRLMLGRDRLGIKPLHYACRPAGLLFGSEAKAILGSGSVECELDVRALHDLLAFGFVRSSRTLFSGVRRLLPGQYALYEHGVLSLHRYWLPEPPDPEVPSPHRSADDWVAAFSAKLEESVRIHLRSDVPLGAWLSSGIDSSTVVTLACRLAGRPLPTFTLTFDEGDPDELAARRTLDRFPGYEVPNERVLCDRSAFRLYPTALWHGESLSLGSLDIANLVLSRASARRVTVVLTGEGSDEILGGYPWFKLDRLLRPFSRLPRGLRQLAHRVPLLPEWKPRSRRLLGAPREMTMSRYRYLIGPQYPDGAVRMLSAELRAQLGHVADDDDPAPPPRPLQHYHPFDQLQYRELTVRLPDLIVHRLDRASMAVGLEARVPFLDHELVELCLQMPPSLKLRGLTEKYVLRRAMRGTLPDEVLRRRKWGLQAPFRRWLREAPPPFVEDLLAPKRIREKGYLEPEVVDTMWTRHRAGTDVYAEALLGALAIQLWDEIFVRGRGPFVG